MSFPVDELVRSDFAAWLREFRGAVLGGFAAGIIGYLLAVIRDRRETRARAKILFDVLNSEIRHSADVAKEAYLGDGLFVQIRSSAISRLLDGKGINSLRDAEMTALLLELDSAIGGFNTLVLGWQTLSGGRSSGARQDAAARLANIRNEILAKLEKVKDTRSR